jgi:hypothetical protein
MAALSATFFALVTSFIVKLRMNRPLLNIRMSVGIVELASSTAPLMP